METIIDRKLPVPIVPGPINETYLDSIGVDAAGKRNVGLVNALGAYQNSTLTQDVLDVLGERHKLKLRLFALGGGSICAKDDKGTLYYLIGSWWDCRYVCRGLVKRRKGVRRATFLINGQASTGTIQVEHYGEQLQIRYPEIKEILDNLYYNKKPAGKVPRT